MTNKKTFWSFLWNNPRCHVALGLAGAGALFFYIGSANLYLAGLLLVPGAVLALLLWRREIRTHALKGKSHTGESGYLSRREAHRWRSRDKCVVVYDPALPSKSVWIGQP